VAQPPVAPVKPPRQLVRVIPFAAQRTFRNAALAAAGTFVAEFDVAFTPTDGNQFLAGAFPGIANPPSAVGPYLDAVAFCDVGGGRLDVEYAVDLSCSYRFAMPGTVVPANTLTNISALRVTGRFVRVTYTNTSVGAQVAEFGVYLRSN
jgi:hypothetical protein